MATTAATVAFVQERLRPPRFVLKPMFGEYALYADGKVVALVCDDRVFVKVHEATQDLAGSETAPPYPGAKPHYVVEEGRLADPGFARMLLALAKALPEPKRRAPTAKKPATKPSAKETKKKR